MRQFLNNHEEEKKETKWLCTFNDMVTLLMVFFVLLFTMSSIDVIQLKTFKSSLQSGLGVLNEGDQVEVTRISETQGEEAVSRTDSEKTLSSEEVKKAINDIASEPGVGAVCTKDKVVITLDDTVLFHSGMADISQKAFFILDRIAAIIKKCSAAVRIEGHTDNVPISTYMFPSNWELSAARAVNVVKRFVDKGKIPPGRLSAAGYGETRPLCPNDCPENKARNRRVEIVLLMKEEK